MDNHNEKLRHDINVCSCYLMFIFMNIIRTQPYHPTTVFGWGKHKMAFIMQLKTIKHPTHVQLSLLILITSFVTILLKQTPYIVL